MMADGVFNLAHDVEIMSTCMVLPWPFPPLIARARWRNLSILASARWPKDCTAAPTVKVWRRFALRGWIRTVKMWASNQPPLVFPKHYCSPLPTNKPTKTHLPQHSCLDPNKYRMPLCKSKPSICLNKSRLMQPAYT